MSLAKLRAWLTGARPKHETTTLDARPYDPERLIRR